MNIHLFHDASNLISITKSPSIYSDNRQKALKYAVEKIKQKRSDLEKDKHHFAVFGDLNFRLDLGPLIEVNQQIVFITINLIITSQFSQKELYKKTSQ